MVDKYEFPTEVIELPSRGLLYPKEHPLSNGQIEIKQMTAKEEDILSSQNLIKRGVVLDKLFESIIVDKRINPSEIILGDKNAIIFATRLLGYGPSYKFSFYSTRLDKKIETEIDLTTIKVKDIDYSIFKNENLFEFTTPFGKNKVMFKLLTHGDELNIDRELAAIERTMGTDVSFDVTTRLRHMIVSVDGNSEVATVNKFANNMSARDSRALRNYIKAISPDLDMKLIYTYTDGEEDIIPITLGVNFFWPSE